MPTTCTGGAHTLHQRARPGGAGPPAIHRPHQAARGVAAILEAGCGTVKPAVDASSRRRCALVRQQAGSLRSAAGRHDTSPMPISLSAATRKVITALGLEFFGKLRITPTGWRSTKPTWQKPVIMKKQWKKAEDYAEQGLRRGEKTIAPSVSMFCKCAPCPSRYAEPKTSCRQAISHRGFRIYNPPRHSTLSNVSGCRRVRDTRYCF